MLKSCWLIVDNEGYARAIRENEAAAEATARRLYTEYPLAGPLQVMEVISRAEAATNHGPTNFEPVNRYMAAENQRLRGEVQELQRRLDEANAAGENYGMQISAQDEEIRRLRAVIHNASNALNTGVPRA